MRMTKCIELTDEECLAIEDTVRILNAIIAEFFPDDESYEHVLCYLIDAMENGRLPNFLKL